VARLAAEAASKVRSRIETVALRQMIHSGYNSLSMREVAKAAKVPVGSLYNYFQDKEALFQHLVETESRHFLRVDGPLMQYLMNSKFPTDLETMALTIAKSVEDSSSYFKLMYIDVVEFEGRHFRRAFENLDEKFHLVLGQAFQTLGQMGPQKNLDPGFVFTTIYLFFYQYFILTKLFGAKQILGKNSERKTVQNILLLFQHGFQGIQ
jgi:AcrR family transcriptional regulator